VNNESCEQRRAVELEFIRSVLEIQYSARFTRLDIDDSKGAQVLLDHALNNKTMPSYDI
jgi:hypothetical protein